MDELQNTSRMKDNDSPTIERILLDIDRLLSLMTTDSDWNTSSTYSPLEQMKIIPSLYCHSSSSTTITNVTITDDNQRLIEHLHQRINRLEHERNVLLTSYQLLIKLLK